jgi:hypothetical protein
MHCMPHSLDVKNQTGQIIKLETVNSLSKKNNSKFLNEKSKLCRQMQNAPAISMI